MAVLEKYKVDDDVLFDEKFEVEIIVYVPSTNYDKKISKEEFDKRTLEVEMFLSNLFGGATEIEGEGVYLSDIKKLIQEDVRMVKSFAKKDDYERNKYILVNKIREWGKKWKQEAMAIEIEGDLYLIRPNKKYKFRMGGLVELNKINYFNPFLRF